MTELCDLTATAMLARIAAGSVTAAEVLESCLARIAAREAELRVFAHLDAAAARAALAGARGPLGGLPLGVKDVIDVAGMPTQCNSPIWQGWVARADAACVALARAAGAVVLGKTVTTEFATRHPGPTANPHNPAHTPGGSSSGSAAGVAAGFFPFAFGTQTAGSIIRPAAYCGVVGYKPSYGLIHRGGMRVISESLDTIGVIARSVADCALLVAAVTGLDLGDPERHPGRPPRLLLTRGPEPGAAAPSMLALLDRAAQSARRRGATVLPCEMPPVIAAAQAAQPLLAHAEGAQALAWELAAHPDRLSEGLRARLTEARAQGAAALLAARRAARAAREAIPAVLDGHDAIITPAAPGEAPAGLGSTGEPTFNALWTALHLPCVTVPAGHGPRGLPLGLQIVGPPGGDRAALAWAAWMQDALAG